MLNFLRAPMPNKNEISFSIAKAFPIYLNIWCNDEQSGKPLILQRMDN